MATLRAVSLHLLYITQTIGPLYSRPALLSFLRICPSPKIMGAISQMRMKVRCIGESSYFRVFFSGRMTPSGAAVTVGEFDAVDAGGVGSICVSSCHWISVLTSGSGCDTSFSLINFGGVTALSLTTPVHSEGTMLCSPRDAKLNEICGITPPLCSGVSGGGVGNEVTCISVL